MLIRHLSDLLAVYNFKQKKRFCPNGIRSKTKELNEIKFLKVWQLRENHLWGGFMALSFI